MDTALRMTTAGVLMLLAGWAGAAEFDGNCTNSLANEVIHPTDCSIKTEYEGKEYCFGDENARATFMKDPQATIAKAAAFYTARSGDGEPAARQKISQQEALAEISSADCDLSNKDLGYLEFNKMNLGHCKMVNTSFFGAYLMGADLSGADLRGAYLNLARLENAKFDGANLSDATIFQAIFDNTSFKNANLSNARMIGTLGDVDMSGADVRRGRFGLDIGNQPMGQMKFDSVSGNFAGTNFEDADLNIANFSFADLTNANLRNANLYRADLSQADLTGADLSGANLTDATVDGATFKDAKGMDRIKGWDTVKGKCRDCS